MPLDSARNREWLTALDAKGVVDSQTVRVVVKVPYGALKPSNLMAFAFAHQAEDRRE